MITPLRMISRCLHVPSVFPACSSLPKESGYVPGYRSQGCPSHPWGPEAVTNKVHTRTHSASSLFSGPVPAESSASPLLPPEPSSKGLWPHSHTRRRVPGWCSCMAGWSCQGRRRARSPKGQHHTQSISVGLMIKLYKGNQPYGWNQPFS